MNEESRYSRKVVVATNLNCNLKCIYCYEHEKKSLLFDVDEAFKMLDELLRIETANGTKIKLHGGEPFLVFPKIKELCERLWRKEYQEYFHIHITTNGTLVHGGVQEWLCENREKLTLKLSLDGDKVSNDMNRPGSFDLIDIPFFVRTWPDIRVNMTITPQTINALAHNVKFIYSTGVKYIITQFSLMTDWAACGLQSVFYEQLMDIVDYYLDNPEVVPCRFFDSDIAATLIGKVFNSACNGSKTKAYDLQTKSYYPCHMCFPSLGGEKLARKLERIDLTNQDELETQQCLKCPFVNLCATCYAENFISRGDVSRRDMSLCSYQKLIFVAQFKYEYARIMRTDNPKPEDVRKMMAIQKWAEEIESIENSVLL